MTAIRFPRRAAASRAATATALIAIVAVGTAGAGAAAPAASAAGLGENAPNAGAQTQSAAAANPAASRAPSAAFRRYCFEAGQQTRCNIAALADIDVARTSEHLAPLVLPNGFATRSAPAQLQAVANLERQARHLPSMAPSTALNARAQAGAVQDVDPTGPADYTWGSNLASGYATPLAADFGWMYDDGPSSPNLACTSRGGAACWAHRDNILAVWAGSQGTGDYVAGQGAVQLSELFVENY